MISFIVVIARRTLPGEIRGDLDEVGVSIVWMCVFRSVCEKENNKVNH